MGGQRGRQECLSMYARGGLSNGPDWTRARRGNHDIETPLRTPCTISNPPRLRRPLLAHSPTFLALHIGVLPVSARKLPALLSLCARGVCRPTVALQATRRHPPVHPAEARVGVVERAPAGQFADPRTRLGVRRAGKLPLRSCLSACPGPAVAADDLDFARWADEQLAARGASSPIHRFPPPTFRPSALRRGPAPNRKFGSASVGGGGTLLSPRQHFQTIKHEDGWRVRVPRRRRPRPVPAPPWRCRHPQLVLAPPTTLNCEVGRQGGRLRTARRAAPAAARWSAGLGPGRSAALPLLTPPSRQD